MTTVPTTVSPGPIRVTGDVLADLGGGASRPATVRFLRSAQLAKHLHLILFLVRSAPAGRRAAADEALAVVSAAQEADAGAVADLLSGPFVGAWLSSAVRHRGTGGTHLDRLAAVAVVAALRTGLTWESDVPATGGVLDLPGVGRAAAGARDTVRVAVAGGRLSIAGAELEATRVIRLGDSLAVDFEDLDPYRDCYHVPAAARRPDDEVAGWRSVLAEAWALLGDRAPDYAAELAAGLRSVVPLVAEPGNPGVSATSRIAFGAVGLSRPRRPDHLAATLVHEFQHSKLSALLDLITLYESGSPQRYFAPWRRDARPVGGLLQGAVAFLAVGDLWRRLGTDIDTLDASERDFADLREQLGEVLGTLGSAEALTEDGRRLVASLRSRFATMLGDAVSADRAAAARDRLERRRRVWAEFNAGSVPA